METLYVVEPGAYLKKNGDSLDIVKEKKIIGTIPAKGLQKILISGYVSLSGAVIDFCIKNRIETVFITPTGKFRGRLMIDEHRHVALREAQYVKLSQEEFCRNTMAIIVKGKIDNMAAFLLKRNRNRKEDKIRTTAIRLRGFSQYLSESLSREAIRGVEGAATRIYFMAFNNLLHHPHFTFKNRSRRPPLDPVNALLSFVYTLLTNEVLSAIKICGLDPYKGSLHEISYGRPSLACDLVEEYRCMIGDSLVLNLINRNMIKPDDFVIRNSVPSSYIDEEDMKKKRPVEMKPYLCRAFITSYEKMMTHGSPSYRNLIRSQVRQFSDYLLEPKKGYKTICV
ncbi:CRISPR-associated protein Cas1 [Desulfamplus magnetovallimortis]|uniref:CRISPR-associated endonuclease Cas1 n=1 Tax=Desulfamplus magnetovallimortis TaxID=1246637 RepID=A0A1W1HF76_9BACT|nr:CRISPR-associated endonuclease Cas1 [Desulfamplus magnetovallimortis]SLM31161.1 CRISPR-associated protein Cas1 [Desulfamplus magnetovallimortis]